LTDSEKEIVLGWANAQCGRRLSLPNENHLGVVRCDRSADNNIHSTLVTSNLACHGNSVHDCHGKCGTRWLEDKGPNLSKFKILPATYCAPGIRVRNRANLMIPHGRGMAGDIQFLPNNLAQEYRPSGPALPNPNIFFIGNPQVKPRHLPMKKKCECAIVSPENVPSSKNTFKIQWMRLFDNLFGR
jgi:hypothetical protein